MNKAYWGFSIDHDLYLRAVATLSEVRTLESGTKGLSKAVAEIVHELVKTGLDAYYKTPSTIVGLTPSTRAAVDHGIKIVTGAIKIVINQFFGSLNKPKLQMIGCYIEDLLQPGAEPGQVNLIFALDAELQAKILEVLSQVRGDRVSKEDIDEAIGTLQQVVDLCIVHYYQKPSDIAELSGLTRAATDLGIRNVQRVFHTFLNRLLSKLDRAELETLSSYLESLVHHPDKGIAAS